MYYLFYVLLILMSLLPTNIKTTKIFIQLEITLAEEITVLYAVYNV